jgi:rhomboid family GlyGly-CTERM serine protease
MLLSTKTPFMRQQTSKYPNKPEQYIPYTIIFVLSTIAFLALNVVFAEHFDLLNYHRSSIDGGQWWRIITGHLLHTNFIHLAVNLIGLVLLWLLHGDYVTGRRFLWHFLFLSLGISFAIMYLSPNIQWYVGLSGVLHGFFVWGAMLDVYYKRKSGYLLLIGIVIKLVDEQFFADQSFMSGLIEASVAIDAHLYGAVLGLVIGAIAIYKK